MRRLFVLRDERSAAALQAFLRSNAKAMASQGRPLAVTVEEYKARRNDAQNRLYWAVLRNISEDAWVDGRQFTSEQWHGYFAGKFIGWADLPGGRQIPISTTSLSVGEFADYVTQVQAYAVTTLGMEDMI